MLIFYPMESQKSPLLKMNCKSNLFLCLLLLTIGCNFGESEASQQCDPERQFSCKHGYGCTSLQNRCDGDNDCTDGSDETPQTCVDCASLEDRFQCANGKCIKARDVCNGLINCRDASDETAALCISCNGDADKWMCRGPGSTKCIRKYYKCDGEYDCGENDQSDEDPSMCSDNCGGAENRFQCANKKCVLTHRLCDGIDDCGDGSDESDKICANCNGVQGKVKCRASSRCFYESDRCDGYNSCNLRGHDGTLMVEDNTDEENCPPK